MLLDLKSATKIASRALAAGGRIARPHVVTWDVSGRCLSPVPVTLTGRPVGRSRRTWAHPADRYSTADPRFWRTQIQREKTVIVTGGSSAPLWLDISARCRRCSWCLKQRSMLWTHRALAEIRDSSRTWFGTLTLSAESHYLMACRAAVRLAKTAVQFDALPDADQFAERHRECSKEITLFLKRVREASGRAPIRLICVAERHKSGLPHYHLLLHEKDPLLMLRKSMLEAQWRFGFSSWRLVDQDQQSRAAWYVAKYLGKGVEARVRASVSYGSGHALGHRKVRERDPRKADPLPNSGLNSVEEQTDG